MRRVPLPLLLGSALGLVGGAVLWQAQPSQDATSLTLRVGRSAFAGNILLYVGERRGTFDRLGLKISYLDSETGAQSLDALEAGLVDVATSSHTPALIRYAQGSDVRVIGSLQHTMGSHAIVYDRARVGGNPQGLAGKRVGCVTGTTSEYFVTHFLLSQGIALDRVTLVPMPLENMRTALQNARVDALSLSEPHLLHTLAKLAPSDVGVFRFDLFRDYSLLVTTPDRMASQSDALKTLLEGLVQTDQWISAATNTEAIRPLVSPAQFEVATNLWGRLKPSVKLDYVLLSEIQDEFLIFRDKYPNQNAAHWELQRLVDPSLLEAASPHSVTVYFDPKDGGTH